MKKVLITGNHSYIGSSFQKYIKEKNPDWTVDAINVHGKIWKKTDFSQYNCVLHLAGKAHADVGTKISTDVRKEYHDANFVLTMEVAKAAKAAGVKQFIFPSSLIIYGESAPYGKVKMITADTKPAPVNFYGDSKWNADLEIQKMNGDDFKTAILRLPMVYGKGSRGNYRLLADIAGKVPVFPDVKNERSMIYIENLCEFLREIIEYEDCGIFYPQNAQYISTSRLVKTIAEVSGKKVRLVPALNPFVCIVSKLPGRVGRMAGKAFGSCTYDQSLSVYRGNEYQIYGLEESIRRSEK